MPPKKLNGDHSVHLSEPVMKAPLTNTSNMQFSTGKIVLCFSKRLITMGMSCLKCGLVSAFQMCFPDHASDCCLWWKLQQTEPDRVHLWAEILNAQSAHLYEWCYHFREPPYMVMVMVTARNMLQTVLLMRCHAQSLCSSCARNYIYAVLFRFIAAWTPRDLSHTSFGPHFSVRPEPKLQTEPDLRIRSLRSTHVA